MELPYEKYAMAGNEMPQSVTGEADRLMYYGLVLLYRLHRAKQIERDDAKKFKQDMLFELDKLKRTDAMWTGMMKRAHDMWRDTEAALTQFRLNKDRYLASPSQETATELVRIVESLDAAISPRQTDQAAATSPEADHETEAIP